MPLLRKKVIGDAEIAVASSQDSLDQRRGKSALSDPSGIDSRYSLVTECDCGLCIQYGCPCADSGDHSRCMCGECNPSADKNCWDSDQNLSKNVSWNIDGTVKGYHGA